MKAHTLSGCAGALLLAAGLYAQGQPVLVKDIHTGPATTHDYGEIVAGVREGAWTYFLAAEPGINRIRLWRTDDTTPGTTLVKSFAGTFDRAGAEMVARNGLVFFTAPNSHTGDELWRSDGTTAGTFALEINPGLGDSTPRNLVVNTAVAATQVYFSATKPTHGRELCRTDGTVAGTVMVADVFPGPTSSMTTTDPIAPGRALISGTVTPVMYFAAADSTHGVELFRLSTSAVLAADIAVGAGSSTPRNFASDNGYLMFTATGSFGEEPYFISNGGVMSVVEILPGRAGSAPGRMIAVPQTSGAVFCFMADDGVNGSELWRRTSGGILQRFDLAPGAADADPQAWAWSATEVLVVAGASGSRQLYRLGLTTGQGTAIGLGTNQPQSVYPLLDSPRRALVTTTSPSGAGLFGTDGTLAANVNSSATPIAALPTNLALLSDGKRSDGNTTAPVVPPAAANGSSLPRSLVEVSPGVVLFVANSATSPSRPYRSDGTTAGTIVLADVAVVGEFSPAYNGKRYFLVGNANSTGQLWATDGTPAGTVVVANLPAGSSGFPSFALCGDYLSFVIGDLLAYRLWRTGGTAANTVEIATVGGSFFPPAFLTVEGIAYFGNATGSLGRELWRTDGTAAGTYCVKDINPGSASGLFGAVPTPLPSDPSQLVFWADDGVHGVEPWRSGGTSTTTLMIKDIRPGTQSSISSSFYEMLGVTSSHLFFVADDGVHGLEPWSTDGTVAQTTLVADVWAGSGDSHPARLGSVGSTCFFIAYAPVWTNTARQLWCSDGSAATTTSLGDFPLESSWRQGVALSGKLLFGVGTSMVRPWTSAGTAPTTTHIADIHAMPVSIGPAFFRPGGAGKALFRGSTSPTGGELWVTDGTTQGTVMHSIIAPSSQPGFLATGNKIFFSGNDGMLGDELYVMTGMASALAYGAGCAGTGGNVPSLAAVTLPVLGTSFDLAISRARSSSPVVLYVGFAPGQQPIGGNCSLLWSLSAPSVNLTGASDTNGRGSIRLPVPNALELEGLQLYCQSAVLDPAGAFANLAAFSNGLQAVLGRP